MGHRPGNEFRLSPAGNARRSAMLTGLAAAALAGCRTAPPIQAEAAYPAIGKRLRATFAAFRAELDVHSTSSLTWFLPGADGSVGRSETVAIRIQSVASQVFLVTGQEASKTTVVQVHDFARNVIFTNVTRPDGTFLQSRGTLVEA